MSEIDLFPACAARSVLTCMFIGRSADVLCICGQESGHQEPHICRRCGKHFTTSRPAERALEQPPAVRAGASDTELEAADRVKPSASSLRNRVEQAARSRGPTGLTGWEAVEVLQLQSHETSVRPRLTELASSKFGRILIRTERRRENRHGNREAVYVHRDFFGAPISDEGA